MNTVYLILGTNKGERFRNLELALQLLEEKAGKIRICSGIYVTAPWGNPDQDDFYNQVICLDTELEASSLLERALMIEEELGRKRDGQKWMARSMDIDILFFNEEVIATKELNVPHPHMQDRRFVLMPMTEVAGELRHPILKRTMRELLSDCPDTLNVKLLN